MATIRKHRGKHQAIIRKKGFPLQSKVFTRRADAVAWASITESEMERGEFVDRTEADRTLLRDALQKYLEEVTPRKKGAKQERVRIAYWRRHRLAKKAISRVTARDMAEWRDSELGAGKAAATVNNGLILISHLFNHARKEWGYPIRNPVEDIWRPKLPKGRERRLLEEEEAKILEAAGKLDAVFPKLIEFAIETAMRRGELANLRRDYIKGAFIQLPETKNGERRDIPLSKKAREILSGLPRYIDGRVWPFDADQITKLFQQTTKAAAVDNVTFHDLRHEATSRLAKKYQIHELARVTGHKTLTMLMRYYHPTGDELAARLVQA